MRHRGKDVPGVGLGDVPDASGGDARVMVFVLIGRRWLAALGLAAVLVLVELAMLA